MAQLANLARMTVTGTPGTGTITLDAAVSGFLTFAQAGVGDGDVVSYGIRDNGSSEVGTGTYTASGTSLTRTVTKSTNSDSPIDATSDAEVYITLRAEDVVSAGTATNVTVANEAADTTCFPLFVTAATGDLAPKTNSAMGFNASTGALNLTEGLSVRVDTPTIGGSSYGSAFELYATAVDASGIDPSFGNLHLIGSEFTSWNSDNNYVTVSANASAVAKTSMMPIGMTLNYHGAGQKFFEICNMHAYGMGDAFLHSEHMDYYCGPIAGDEGQGYTPYFEVFQGHQHPRANVTSVTRSTINTTLTQHVIGSKTAQTVTVASSTGASVGDWVVVNQGYASGADLIEAVQLTAVAAGTISGKFRYNYSSGMAITPALVLGVNSLVYAGQQRVIVNLDGAVYDTGEIASSAGAALTGSGTTFTTGMVGGDTLNIGAIALEKDEYTGTPFASDALRSWYQITAVTSATELFIHSYSAAGDQSYRGTGSFPSDYEIRPAARALWIDHVHGNLICETSTHTWTPGDIVECVHCPYPDVHGFQYYLGAYSSGTTGRFFTLYTNNGARTLDFGLGVSGFYNPTNDGGGDTWAYLTGIKVTGAQVGLKIDGPADYGIQFSDGMGAFTKGLYWTTGSQEITANSDGGFNVNNTIHTSRSGTTNRTTVIGQGSAPSPAVGSAVFEVQSGPAAVPAVPAFRIAYSFNSETQNLFQAYASDVALVLAKLDRDCNWQAQSVRGRVDVLSNINSFVGTPVEGMLATVTDSTVNTWGATIAGGGANRVLAYYNGTNWTVAGV